MTHPLPRCPTCQQRDQVVSLAALVAAEATPLARMLAPPRQPKIEPISPWSRWAGWLIISAGTCSILTGLITIWPALAQGAVDSQLIQLSLSLIFGLGIVGGGFATLRSNAKKATKREAQVAVDLHRWEAAMKRWERLFYCARDEGIFDPTENTALIPPTEMLPYLES